VDRVGNGARKGLEQRIHGEWNMEGRRYGLAMEEEDLHLDIPFGVLLAYIEFSGCAGAHTHTNIYLYIRS